MISGIGWVSGLIEAAGGLDVFANRASGKSAKDRIVTAEEVIRTEPDIIIGSWCGKKFRPEKLATRPGCDRIPAVKYGALHEIKSSLILHAGPAALTDGLAAFAGYHCKRDFAKDSCSQIETLKKVRSRVCAASQRSCT